MMQTRRSHVPTPITADVPTTAALMEIHRRLSSIHHGLAVGDGDVVPLALDKLDALLREIDDAVSKHEHDSHD